MACLDLDGALWNMKFNIGMTYITNGVDAKIKSDDKFAKFVANSFKRHVNGDWGELCEEDKQLNERALKNGDDRLFSRYENGENSIYIITEWDRSVTTILFPNEY